MTTTRQRLRQVVDWRATFWAGFLGGLISLGTNMVLTHLNLGSPWIFLRMVASIVLGEGSLLPPSYSQFNIILVGIIVHLLLSGLFAALLTIIIHRWGLLVGILGGAAFGLALYTINFSLMSIFFPWFFPLQNWMFALSHVLFGALVGGIYEMLEVEIFVPAEK